MAPMRGKLIGLLASQGLARPPWVPIPSRAGAAIAGSPLAPWEPPPLSHSPP